ncbi:hypothetical protein ECP030529315_5350, partial [Escherichia coli p0305293.15]
MVVHQAASAWLSRYSVVSVSACGRGVHIQP